jgi:8-oxo-dGTP diphosphatase
MPAVTSEVHAAGGVVVRDGRVAVVHRPKYDDWSLPKGKLHPGERWEDAALREVREETGLECALGEELSPTRYRDPRDRPKVVRYWRMTPLGGTFAPNAEVDELRWEERDDALALLTHPHDRALVAGALPAGDGRH